MLVLSEFELELEFSGIRFPFRFPGSGGRADDISMSSYGKAKGNSVYDSQREPLYYPLPYATTHIPNHVQEHHPSAGSPDQSLQRTRGGDAWSSTPTTFRSESSIITTCLYINTLSFGLTPGGFLKNPL
ncbi:hypothetical protein CEXT_384361 [Caerostris extrusa]|uniref:Uncharacterized protein n=1 Tax=Caerostris extrusa TaxID=172846 RepID=A0AAV4VMA0_CAEEX|nr:hypothetical protein CEXT_384361 [Caerostris extrusa]